MEAEEVARNQRGRLQGAMVEAVARHGFWDTTLRELVSLAGVSKSTFYEHFDGQAGLLPLDLRRHRSRGRRPRRPTPSTSRETCATKLLAGITTLLTVIAEEQAATSLVTVESLTLGPVAVPHRERASERFEEADPRGPSTSRLRRTRSRR